jgi:RNA polymerase sigma-70 factor (ECF subfamily)
LVVHDPLPTDAALVGRTLTGDRTAFGLLVRRHYRAAFAVALAHAGNRSDAEDVCHDAFVRAGARLADCRDADRFAAWLCTIVRNLAKNAVSRGFARRATTLPDNLHALDDPGRQAERADLGTRLESALTRLPPTQREVVLLHDLDGRTHEEIAALIGTSTGMSRQHLFQARRALRELLGRNTSKEYFNG